MIAITLQSWISSSITKGIVFVCDKSQFHKERDSVKALLSVLCFIPMSVMACGVENVTLDKLRAESKHDLLYIYGTMKHNCPNPTGIQLRITVNGKNGELADVRKMWPASVKNIPPNEPYPFNLLAETNSVKGTFNVDVESVKEWKTR